MLRNFFKVAIRNLLKSKGFSVINLLGLSIGMASAMLICIWIVNEIRFEQFHEKKDRIYEVWNKAAFSGKMNTWNTTPKVLARTIEKDVPEVEAAVRVDWTQNKLFSIGEKRLMIRGIPVDSNFLQVFSFPMLQGNPLKALDGPRNLVITEGLAEKLFGTKDAMGKEVKVDNKDVFVVTGIVKNLPLNTRFDFEFLMPWSVLREAGNDDPYWGNNSTRTYVLLKQNASFDAAMKKVKPLKTRYDSEDPKWELFLYPMAKWHLYSSFSDGKEDGEGRILFVKLFAIVAAFILLIACINFMNLSTARSEKRAREVGIRKVVGAQKQSLIMQFLGESLMLALLSGIIAVALVHLFLPAFGELIDRKMEVEYNNPWFWSGLLSFVIITGLLAGSYPAFFLSSFQPVKVLKGTMQKANALIAPRKVLVVLQFTFSITLIICTIIVKQQIDHAQQRDNGYDKHNLIYHLFTGDIEKNSNLIKQELLSTGVASSVTKTSAPITQSWSDGWGQEWEGKDPNDKTDFFRYNQDEKLGTTAGLQFIKGRDFDLAKYPTDSNGVLINESSLKVMKFKEPLGQIIRDNGQEWHVVGVIKDFILTNPYEPTRPMLIYGANSWLSTMLIRLNEKNSTSDNLKKAEAIFKKYNPEYPFEFRFVDEEYNAKFENERRTGVLASLFAGLTIFITCLGLFGLATYMAENRIKEIGVRKVLGASVSSITALMSKEFLALVVVSFLLASPIAWWMMHNWLSNYSYAVGLHWWVFALAAFIAIAISAISVSYQSIRAATSNPVKSLRTE